MVCVRHNILHSAVSNAYKFDIGTYVHTLDMLDMLNHFLHLSNCLFWIATIVWFMLSEFIEVALLTRDTSAKKAPPQWKVLSSPGTGHAHSIIDAVVEPELRLLLEEANQTRNVVEFLLGSTSATRETHRFLPYYYCVLTNSERPKLQRLPQDKV